MRFWTEAIGLELMTRFGADAAFLADGGYHHHVGVNAWFSRGAELEPPDGPGLDQVVVGVDDPGAFERLRGRVEAAGVPVSGSDGRVETSTPDGVPVAIEASVRPHP